PGWEARDQSPTFVPPDGQIVTNHLPSVAALAPTCPCPTYLPDLPSALAGAPHALDPRRPTRPLVLSCGTPSAARGPDCTDKSWLFQVVDAETKRLRRSGLLGIGTNEFQVRRRPECDQGIPGPQPKMLASGRRSHAEQTFDGPYPPIEIWRRVHKMVDLRK